MANVDDETVWQELTDPEVAKAHRAHGRHLCKKKAVGISALVGVAVVLVIFYSSTPGTRVPRQPSQLAGVFTVDGLNDILGTMKIIDAEDAFKTLLEPQLEALFTDFLSNTGSSAPRRDGTFQRDAGPRKQLDTPEEHTYRFKVFSENLLEILRRNANTQRSNPEPFRAVFGITQFADWTLEEFKLMRSMSGTNTTELEAHLAKHKAATRHLSPQGLSDGRRKGEAQALPDCATYYPVRNQKGCGDCWAFATAEVIRMRVWKENNKGIGPLSVQQLVDCDPDEIGKHCSDGVNGCCGGVPWMAINWLHESGGIATVEAYGPLVSDDHPFYNERCHNVPKAVLPGKALFPSTETVMAQWLCEYGAISISIDASPLNSYSSGVLGPSACPNRVDHAVLLIGIDTQTWEYSDGTKVPVWIVQNSWGTSWGVQPGAPYKSVAGKSGFFLLQWGQNTCKIMTQATIPKSAEFLS